MKPKKYEKIVCNNCHAFLEPKIEQIRGYKGVTIYDVEYWYCPDCHLVYHYSESITVKD